MSSMHCAAYQCSLVLLFRRAIQTAALRWTGTREEVTTPIQTQTCLLSRHRRPHDQPTHSSAHARPTRRGAAHLPAIATSKMNARSRVITKRTTLACQSQTKSRSPPPHPTTQASTNETPYYKGLTPLSISVLVICANILRSHHIA